MCAKKVLYAKVGKTMLSNILNVWTTAKFGFDNQLIKQTKKYISTRYFCANAGFKKLADYSD